MPGVIADGNDPVSVYNATQDAVARARAGKGPTLIECKTYRMFGHFNGDPARYRPQEEVEAWKAKEPIKCYTKYLVDKKLFTEDELKAVEDQARKEIADAIEFAAAQPFAPVESVAEDVYTDIVEEVHDR